jgi:hypothetical protein
VDQGFDGRVLGMRSSDDGICGISGGFGGLTAVGLGYILDLSAGVADRPLFDVCWLVFVRLKCRMGALDGKIPSGNASARKFVVDRCLGKLERNVFTRDGEDFAVAYYPTRYFTDYQRALVSDPRHVYTVEETEENYARVAGVIDDKVVSNGTPRPLPE